MNKEKKYILEDMTYIEIEEAVDQGIETIVIPIGSTEGHGPHLILSSDSITCTLVGKKIAKKLGCILAPTQPYGQASTHRKFKGTISLTNQTLIFLTEDICNSVIKQGFKKIMIINGNEENIPALSIAARNIKEKTGCIITVSSWHKAVEKVWMKAPGIKDTELENDTWYNFAAHGGLMETSVIMSYKPYALRMDLAKTVKSTQKVVGDMGLVGSEFFYPADFDEISESGHGGNPENALKEMGEFLVEAAADQIIQKHLKLWDYLDNNI